MMLILHRNWSWLLAVGMVVAGAPEVRAGLLDDIGSTPMAAYSLRQLSDSYVGPAIRVRRGGDNLQMDIGFTMSGGLDITSLESFVSGGNGSGFVTTWYNQTGNASFNAVEGTAAEQPQIAAGGSVLMAANGLPAVRFPGGAQNLNVLGTGGLINKNDVFTIAEFSAQPGDNLTAMRLWNLPMDTSTRLSAGGNDGQHGVSHHNGTAVVHFQDVDIVLNEVFLSTLVADGTAGAGNEFIRYHLNGDEILEIANTTILANDNNLILGNQQDNLGPRGLNGFIAEFLLFSGNSNLSAAERDAIERNMMIAAGLLQADVIPEPGSAALWSLLAIGLAGYWLWRHKRLP